MRRAFSTTTWLLLSDVLLIVAACSWPSSPLETPSGAVRPKDIISITRADTGTLVADGKTGSMLIALIPAAATSKSVTFTSTAGLFVESASKQVTVIAVPDTADKTKLVARTLFQADTLAAFAIVRATVSTYYDTLTVMFAKPTP